MPETSHRLTWVREGARYPVVSDLDSFIALDGEAEVGVVKLVPAPTGQEEWMWSMLLVRGPAFNRPTNGRTQTRGGAVRELLECWGAFRAYYGIED